MNRHTIHFRIMIIGFGIMLLFWAMPYSTHADSNREILRLGRGTANSVDWRPDGKVLAVGSGRGVWLYNSQFEVIGHLDDPEDYVDRVEWSPDGHRLASFGRGVVRGNVQVWDLSDGVPIVGQKLFGAANDSASDTGMSVGWSNNNDLLTQVAFFSTITFIDLKGATPSEQDDKCDRTSTDVTSECVIPYTAISPDGTKLLSATSHSIRLLDPASHEIIQTLDLPTEANLDWGKWAWSSDEHFLARLGNDGSLYTWDVASGKLNYSTVTYSFEPINDMRWSPNNRYLAILGTSNTSFAVPYLEIIDTETWANRLNIRSRESITAFDWESNDSITTTTPRGTIQTWDVGTGKVLAEYRLHTAEIRSLAWSPDGTQIVSAGNELNYPVQVWNVSPPSSDEPVLSFYPDFVDALAWIPQGNRIITEVSDNENLAILSRVETWDANTGKSLAPIYEISNPTGLLAIRSWSHDFSQSAFSSRDNRVTIPGNITLVTLGDMVQNIVWSPDNRKIATVSLDHRTKAYTIETWDSQTGEKLSSIPYPFDLSTVQWSPDDTKLLTSGEDGNRGLAINVYDAIHTDVLFNTSEDGKVWSLGWSFDSGFIAYTSPTKGREVKILNVETGENYNLALTGFWALSLAWHPSKDWLAIGDIGGTIRVWDISDLRGG